MVTSTKKKKNHLNASYAFFAFYARWVLVEVSASDDQAVGCWIEHGMDEHGTEFVSSAGVNNCGNVIIGLHPAESAQRHQSSYLLFLYTCIHHCLYHTFPFRELFLVTAFTF